MTAALVSGVGMRLRGPQPLAVVDGRRARAAVVFVLVVAACPGRVPGDDGNEGEGEGEPPALVPDVACPGDASCSVVAGEPLLAAAAERDVTPRGFEIARPSFLRLVDHPACAPEGFTLDGHTICGELKDNFLDDCGHDGLCFTDDGWTAADTGENDGVIDDYWLDCGIDRICPDNVAEADTTNGRDDDGDGAIDDGPWVAADAGEGDGVFQALWIAGYGNNRPAMTIKDELSARVVAFAQGDAAVAICTVDAVGLFFDEQERIRERIEAARPGAVDLFLLQATHTHEAPDTMGQWGFVNPRVLIPDEPGRSEDHMELIRQGCADGVVEAIDNLVAVNVRVGRVEPGVDNLARDGRDPQIYDDDITAISLEAVADGAVIATLFHWGNHPESLDSDNNSISADYVHAIRTSLEQGLPAGVLKNDTTTVDVPARAGRGGVAVYLQGAVGGLIGPNGFPIYGRDGTLFENDAKTWARTDALGVNLAELGFQALEVAEPVAAPALSFSAISYRAPVENAVFHLGLQKGWFDRAVYDYDENLVVSADNLPHIATGVGVVRIGDIAFATAPGELFPESFVGFADANAFGRPIIDPDNENPPDLTKAPANEELRLRLNARFAMALGLCQDEMGYLVPTYDFKLNEASPYVDEAPGDHYEETNSIGPEALPLVLRHLDALFTFEATR
jgi:hypothetical protein